METQWACSVEMVIGGSAVRGNSPRYAESVTLARTLYMVDIGVTEGQRRTKLGSKICRSRNFIASTGVASASSNDSVV